MKEMVNMITTAHMYNISQTKLDELCHELNVYPVPDYERFFINRFGSLYVISIDKNKNVSLKQLTPNKVEKNGVCEYNIANSRDEIEHITNVQLCARTFFGYFPEEYIRLIDNVFTSAKSITYDLGKIVVLTDDLIAIQGISFKRVYYNGTYRTNVFISKDGIVYNNKKGKIISHDFQHNMYWRNRITVHGQKRVGTHRLVYNTWNNTWLPDTIQINHIDGLKYHNFLDNLEEVSQTENMRHAKNLGLKSKPYAEDFIVTICELIQSNQYDIDEICDLLKMSDSYSAIKSLIRNIVEGRTWKDISSNYDFTAWKNQVHSRKSERLAHAVCKAYVESGYDSASVRYQFPNVSRPYLDEICRGAKFPEIAAQYGLPRKGIKRKALTKVQFTEVRKMLAKGKTVEEITSHFGVNEAVIKNVILWDKRKARLNR